jgi:hypothetical protein
VSARIRRLAALAAAALALALAGCDPTGADALPVDFSWNNLPTVPEEPTASVAGAEGAIEVEGAYGVGCGPERGEARRSGRTVTFRVVREETDFCPPRAGPAAAYFARVRQVDAGTYRVRVIHFGRLVTEEEVTVQ